MFSFAVMGKVIHGLANEVACIVFSGETHAVLRHGLIGGACDLIPRYFLTFLGSGYYYQRGR